MKFTEIVTIVFTVLAEGMVIMSGIMKFVAPPEMAERMSQLGIGSYLPMLGLMEITFALLYAWSKTMRIGFVLLSCYFAGALAVELAHAQPFNALLPMGLVWVSAFLRDREVFGDSVS